MPNQYTAVTSIANVHEIRKALAKVYLDQGLTYREIRRKTGLAPATISATRKGESRVLTSLAEALKKVEEEKLTLGIHAIMDGTITPEKIEKASLQQGVTSAAILIDKRELLAGRATVRFGADLTDEELTAKIEILEKEILEAEYNLLLHDMGDNPETR